MKDSDILNARIQKLQQDFEAQLIACDMLNQENQSKALELKVCIGIIGHATLVAITETTILVPYL